LGESHAPPGGAMPATETFFDIVQRLGLDAEKISKKLGINERNVKRWISGEKHVPDSIKDRVLSEFDPKYKHS
jgi:plasmid maintenance system antidote protein VapI